MQNSRLSAMDTISATAVDGYKRNYTVTVKFQYECDSN